MRSQPDFSGVRRAGGRVQFKKKSHGADLVGEASYESAGLHSKRGGRIPEKEGKKGGMSICGGMKSR